MLPTRPLRLVCLLAVLLTPAAASASQWMYVTDTLHVTIRSGPSVENKVVYRAKSGDKYLTLEPNQDGWAKVQWGEGKTGWMISRYLQDQAPASVRLRELDPQNQSLLSRVEGLASENRSLKTDLAGTQKQMQQTQAAYEELKKQSGGFLKLQTDHEKLKDEYNTYKAQMKELTTEVESLRFGKNLKWFLAGAGVLTMGWIMGLALGRRKRRWSSSLH